MAAALALPGLALSPAARSEAPPDQALLAFKQLFYRDEQPGNQRMRVSSPAAYWLVPVKDAYAIEGYATAETMSGASPYFYSTLSGASGQIRDDRRAADLKGTRYFDGGAVGIGVAASRENDYRSQALRADARIASDDQNTTLMLGAGHTEDRISSTVDPRLREARSTDALLAGVTQVWSPTVIAQATLTAAASRGYHSDPYKLFDRRPDERRLLALQLRINKYVAAGDGALHLDVRAFHDDWGVRAGNVELNYYQPFGNGWMARPSLRYYTQSAAKFYNNRFPPPDPSANYSADQRLAAFGAVSWGMQLSKQVGNDFSLDLAYEEYSQRANWRGFGSGSPGLETFRARFLTLGLQKRF